MKFMRVLRVNRFYKFFRLLRLLKVVRLFKYTKMRSNNKALKNSDLLKFSNSFKSFVNLLLIYLCFNHWMACVWFLQARLNDFPETCWVRRKQMMELTTINKYLSSFYWAFQTLTSVGFGDFNAYGNSEE